MRTGVCSRMTLRAMKRMATVIALTMPPLGAAGAEVHGSVTMDYQGLFRVDASTKNHQISVALLPAEQQRMVRRPRRTEHIEIVNNRMHPAFLTVKQGDRVEFINRDPVYHQLFSLSPGQPLSAQLEKAGSTGNGHSAKFELNEAGTTHFFCRIHNKSYARIDVVETPYLQMINPGQRFHFVGLATGKWRLRLASPAAETRWVTVSAMTSPPPLELSLASRGGGTGSRTFETQSDIGRLYE